MKIKLDNSTAILRQIFKKNLTEKSKFWITHAFESMVKFKLDYEIEDCSSDEETDELLAEYGIYTWNPEESPKFEFTLTRQIQLEGEDEYHQIKINLTFNSKEFVGIRAMSFWAMDYRNLEEWKSDIEKRVGHLRTKEIELLKYEIIIDET